MSCGERVVLIKEGTSGKTRWWLLMRLVMLMSEGHKHKMQLTAFSKKSSRADVSLMLSLVSSQQLYAATR